MAEVFSGPGDESSIGISARNASELAGSAWDTFSCPWRARSAIQSRKNIKASTPGVSRALKDAKWNNSVVVAALNDSRFDSVPPLPGPGALLRRSFAVSQKDVQTARLYVTALGSYRAFLNGQRIGDDVLTPGFTDYSKRLQYQTYDVTSLVSRGSNVLAAELCDGWFACGMAMNGIPYFFQPPPLRLLAQLEINYADRTRDVFVTDESWKVARSPILHSEIYAGELYDARNEFPDWARSRFDDSRWPQASAAPNPLRPSLARSTHLSGSLRRSLQNS